jgi:hypothetical protein
MAEQEFQYGKVGNPTADRLGSGARTPIRLGEQGEVITGDYHGKYYEAVKAGRMFYACNPALQVFSVGLTTTYTGLCVSNPAGSGVDLVMKQASYAHSAVPASVSCIFLIGGHTAAGVVTHTSALAAGARSCKLDGLGGKALVDEECTIVSPLYIMPIMSSVTTASLPTGTSPSLLDLDGSLVVPPGGWVAIVGDLVVTGWAGFIWEEVPI